MFEDKPASLPELNPSVKLLKNTEDKHTQRGLIAL